MAGKSMLSIQTKALYGRTFASRSDKESKLYDNGLRPSSHRDHNERPQDQPAAEVDPGPPETPLLEEQAFAASALEACLPTLKDSINP